MSLRRRRRRARASADPLGRAAPARRRAARLLHERRRRLQRAHRIAKRVFGYDVHGFTIVNADARYEEQEMVEHAVAELGSGTPRSRCDTDALPRGCGRSSASTTRRSTRSPTYAHWLLMQSIAEHGYRISISGTAADELFTGYYDHHLAYLPRSRRAGRCTRQRWRPGTSTSPRSCAIRFSGIPSSSSSDPDFRGPHLPGRRRVRRAT